MLGEIGVNYPIWCHIEDYICGRHAWPRYGRKRSLLSNAASVGSDGLTLLYFSHVDAWLGSWTRNQAARVLGRQQRLGYGIMARVARSTVSNSLYTYILHILQAATCMGKVMLQPLAGRSGELLNAGISVRYSTW